MVERDDDAFRPRLGAPRDYRATQAPRFINRVLKASNRAGGAFGDRRSTTGRRQGRGVCGRGAAAARLAGRGLDHRARRVVIKTRLVNLRHAGARSTQKHLRYIERDGVTRAGQRGELYGADVDKADAGDFAPTRQTGRGSCRERVGTTW